jgi:hypothetical protein
VFVDELRSRSALGDEHVAVMLGDATLNPRRHGESSGKQICRHLKSTTGGAGTRVRAKERSAISYAFENYDPSTPLLRPRNEPRAVAHTIARGASAGGMSPHTRESTAIGSLSSKPVRRRSPTLGRFDSGAAPLSSYE